MVKPVTPELKAPGVVTTPVPAMVVQAPTPTAGLLPARVATVVLHRSWAGPATETLGNLSEVMTTVLEEAAQAPPPLVMVHLKVEEAPMVKPVTPELNAPGVVIVTPAQPAVQVQAPIPTAGLLPARVATVVLHRSWAGPATETLGNLSEVMTTVLEEAAQAPPPLVMVH